MAKTFDNHGPQLSAYLDGELSERGRKEVEAHLESCGTCRDLAHQLAEIDAVLNKARSPSAESGMDLTGVWENIVEGANIGPSRWQRIRRLFEMPFVWVPTTFVTAAVAFLLFVPTAPKHPAPTAFSRVESVYSRTGNVMVLQTAKSGRPLIWILPKKEKEVNS